MLVGLARTMRRNALRFTSTSRAGPIHVPATVTFRPPVLGRTDRCSVDHRRRSACGAQCCHASRTCAAATWLNLMKKVWTIGAGQIATTKEVTAPKDPPPHLAAPKTGRDCSWRPPARLAPLPGPPRLPEAGRSSGPRRETARPGRHRVPGPPPRRRGTIRQECRRRTWPPRPATGRHTGGCTRVRRP